MNYQRIQPSPQLSRFIAWYWCAESIEAAPNKARIIPDGYPEFVFHYGQQFRICLHGQWHIQGTALLGGQMQQYFFLENTGPAGIFGITFHPPALTHLFALNMASYTDRVVDISEVFGPAFSLPEKILAAHSTAARIAASEEYLRHLICEDTSRHPVDHALKILRDRHGLISMEELSREIGLGSRQLQRLFQRYVGVTPKFYARIIRFNTVFAMMRKGGVSWADVVHASGYYDQSHFIRNFKGFTGEDPATYEFIKPTLTNFFAQKSNPMSDLYNTASERTV